jgi:predicted DNA-binding transcriptional regulator AlpA
MSQTSTGLGKRARRVIRRNKLPQYLGVQRSTIDELIEKDLLHPFCPTGADGRAQVVFEDEVAELQERMARAARKGKKK